MGFRNEGLVTDLAVIGFILGGLLVLAWPLAGSERTAAGPPAEWSPIGLLRVRDLTPFGIRRLDFIPVHAVTAQPGAARVIA